MNLSTNEAALNEVNRRDFLRGSSFASLLAMLGAVELKAQDTKKDAIDASKANFTVNVALIGLGNWGREILAALGRRKEAKVVAICDTYPAMLRRSAENAPGAKQVADYHDVLADKDVQAVIIATPTHLHRQIVEEALKAGKHVYCEAPLAHTIEDARAIARAAKNSPKVLFQSGLQFRSDPQRHFLLQFIRSGACGRFVMARAQWHKKTSWRFASGNPEREKAINWRLNKELSTGLAGEIGIHQIDATAWFLRGTPTAVTGFGGVLHWSDGREVADTAQAVFEFPGGTIFTYDAMLANSFDSDYDMIYGSDAAVMIRGNKAWLFKEVDSALLGWEVYARKDLFYKETGIALVANATKSTAQAGGGGEDAGYVEPTINFAIENFLANANEVGNAVEDFSATFNPNDKAALAKYLADLKLQPAAGWKEGFEATVLVIKANEAVATGKRIAISKELFDVA
ncbi:MAG: Gfo/Idh/MocA family oxidoreductase [Verrucomicrobia bacterium]|nr:Gfo/Idh/MocA family oxidoreductase [Verrucomicrobiota bacterium]